MVRCVFCDGAYDADDRPACKCLALRDTFAAAALTGMLAAGAYYLDRPGTIEGAAYDVAEALLRERARRAR